mmetsp:Transcript_18598/g.38314  ORF Transcript_18598/g.38314 Transcript_18598/m.38314 type:complete len:220 (+) Transcript_18598:471-1130(+)
MAAAARAAAKMASRSPPSYSSRESISEGVGREGLLGCIMDFFGDVLVIVGSSRGFNMFQKKDSSPLTAGRTSVDGDRTTPSRVSSSAMHATLPPSRIWRWRSRALRRDARVSLCLESAILCGLFSRGSSSTILSSTFPETQSYVLLQFSIIPSRAENKKLKPSRSATSFCMRLVPSRSIEDLTSGYARASCARWSQVFFPAPGTRLKEFSEMSRMISST